MLLLPWANIVIRNRRRSAYSRRISDDEMALCNRHTVVAVASVPAEVKCTGEVAGYGPAGAADDHDRADVRLMLQGRYARGRRGEAAS